MAFIKLTVHGFELILYGTRDKGLPVSRVRSIVGYFNYVHLDTDSLTIIYPLGTRGHQSQAI